ncbi:MAG: HD domain-containing phosphohydrolase [Pseudomonadota bacterium]
MSVFTPEEIDEGMQIDLKEEIVELYEASEQCLVELELTPKDKELQRALFRSVHTIKGDLGLVGFRPMIAVLQDLEDLLDLLRKDEILYTPLMHDLVLGMLDMVNDFVNSCIKQGNASYDQKIIDEVNAYIRKIQPENATEHESILSDATKILTSGLPKADAQPKEKLAKTGIIKDLSPFQHKDILFFRELMRPIEKRVGYKEGRGDRIARLALYVANASDKNIPLDQLAVACYVHDFGMAFMPNDVVQKAKPSAMETNLMRSHVYKSTRLIEHLDTWDEARNIVMQHHENIDGSGYPLGIKGDEICDGAKLLTIVDRYDAMLNDPEAQFGPKEAIVELNKRYKGQLSNYWLRMFIQSMTTLLAGD